MGGFKKQHADIMDAFPQMWREEVAAVKEQYPHITTEAAKIVALDIAVPQFMMYAMKVMEPKQQETTTTKETKNVKRRPAKEKQSDGKQTEFKLTDAT